MKAVIQRCLAARVEVAGQVVGSIEHGLTVFLGIAAGDGEAEAARLAAKIAALRIFDDSVGRFDLSVLQSGGSVLVISNFTLCGDTRKGTRPSFSAAAAPEVARPLCERFVTLLGEAGVPVQCGVFAAHMNVYVENDGPVTMILEASPAA